jgi:hypothetical protein
MSIFDIFRRNRLRVAWEYAPGAQIWRLLPAQGGRIVGETRDVEKKRARYFGLDLSTGHVLWEGLEFEERWWIGMEATADEVLFLHSYASPDLPLHRGITAVNITTGKLAWVDPSLVLETALEGTSLARQGDANRGDFVEVRNATGEILRRLSDEEYVTARTTRRTSDMNDMAFPESHPDEKRAGGFVEIVESAGFRIVGFHRPSAGSAGESPRLDGVIEVRKAGTLVFRDNTSVGIPAAAPGAFMVAGPMLLYVKDRSRVAAVRLTSASPANKGMNS